MSYTNTLPLANAHFISTELASDMAARYRSHRELILAKDYQDQNTLAFSETFNRNVLDVLLAKSGCAAIRIYYGMDENFKVHAMLVAVDENNADILPDAKQMELESEDNFVVEEGQRCPNLCPAQSPLNA